MIGEFMILVIVACYCFYSCYFSYHYCY